LKELEEVCMPHNFTEEKTLELKKIAEASKEKQQNVNEDSEEKSDEDGPDQSSGGNRLIPVGAFLYVTTMFFCFL